MRLQNLEIKTYKEFASKVPTLIPSCLIANIDLRLVLAILYVEKNQYELASLKGFIRDKKTKLLEKFDKRKLFNFSRGYSNVKPQTADTAYLLHCASHPESERLVSPFDVAQYHKNEDASLRLIVVVLLQHIMQWKGYVPNIANEHAILSTLYNISDYENKTPHAEPKSGGSIMDIVINGELVSNKNFGERVELVYKSNAMNAFFNIWSKEIERRSNT